MKTLFLTSRLPYPPYRGDKLRTYNQIRFLARHHEVVLVSFIQDESERQWIENLRAWCRRVEVVPLSTARSLANCIPAVFTGKSFQVAYYDSATMAKTLSRVLAEERPDILHTHLIRMASYGLPHRGIPRVLDLTDAISLYLERFGSIERNAIKRALLHLELRRLVRFESVMREFDRVLVCSPVDRDFLLRKWPDTSIEVVPNGIDFSLFSPDRVSYTPGRIVFAGNMTYYPNADAARYFVREIFPRIKKAMPGAALFIVGQNPPSSVRKLASEDITVTGFVPDIRSEYLRSAVAVSPMRFGAGTPNKVLEPLALGVPVVATPVGVEGLGLEHGKEIFIEQDPHRFADAVCRMLLDRDQRDLVGQNAMREIRSRFSMEVTIEMLEKIYRDIQKDHVKKH